MRVGGEGEVPPVDVAQQLLEVGVPGDGGPVQEIGADGPERGAAVGLEEDLAAPFRQAAVEGAVVHEVGGAGEGAPVREGAGREGAGAGRHGVGVAGVADPRGPQPRDQVARRGLDRGRFACVPAVLAGGEDRVPGAQRQPALEAVVRLEGRAPYRPVQGGRAAPQPVADPPGRRQGPVRAARAEAQQAVAEPGAARGRGAGGAVAAAGGGGPAEEGGTAGAGQPVGEAWTAQKWSSIRRNSTGRQTSSSGRASRKAKTRSYWSKMSKCFSLVVERMLPRRRCR